MAPTLRHKQVKTALNRQSGGFLSTFTHTLQPYTGCAFGRQTPSGQGCPYCYVRKLPVSLFALSEWGEWVEAKMNIGDVLRGELCSHERRGTLSKLRIFMSSATDPYQGAEASLQLTRSCLEAFVERPPGLIIVQTRSPLVLRDVELLQTLQNCVWVSMTMETNDDEVRKRITPTSPTIGSRVKTMRILKEAGIHVQAAISPMLPNNAEMFAELLEPACTRALIDTLMHGDGANGRRSKSLGMEALFAQYGYEQWYTETAHEPLLNLLRERMGSERVVFSQAGFNEF